MLHLFPTMDVDPLKEEEYKLKPKKFITSKDTDLNS